MRAILVQSIKGGCGKTLVAINIAEELAKKYRVALLDADIDSLPSHTPVVVKQNGLIDVLPIGDLFDSVEGEIRKEGKRLYKTPKNELLIFRGYTNAEPNNWTRIKWLVRHPYNGEIIRINTLAGLVDLSPNHPMLKFGGHGKTFPAENIKEGDVLPQPDMANDHTNGKYGLLIGGKRLAWLYGALAAEGTVSSKIHKSGSYSIYFPNNDLEFVERFKETAEKVFGVHVVGPTKDHQDPSIKPSWFVTINHKRLHAYLREQLYTKAGQKKVPKDILNASDDVIMEFLQGFHEGDGEHGKSKNFIEVDQNSFDADTQPLIAGLAWIIRRTTKRSFSVHIRDDLPNVLSLTINKTDKQQRMRGHVKKIRKYEYDGWLYDLETDDHTFACGIGAIRVHNSPNLPSMLGMGDRMKQAKDGRFIPKLWEPKGVRPIKVVSAGLLDDGQVTLFKTGEETRQIVYDLIMKTEWGDIDYMIADLPAGSGDEFRATVSALAQYITGVVLVTLPITLEDCTRVVELCTFNGIKIYGIIINQDGTMTTCGCEAVCKKCGKPFNPYASDEESVMTAERIAEEFKLTLLGKIPLTEGLYVRVIKGDPLLPERARGAIDETLRVIMHKEGGK